MPNPARTLLLPCLIWFITIPVVQLCRGWWAPQPCTALHDVSGFYGPGVYWAWILTIISATINTLRRKNEDSVSIDFYAVCIYALATMADLQFRLCKTCDIKRDLQAQASLQIAFVSLLCVSVIFMLCQLVFELQEVKRPVYALFGPKRYQVWAAFLFIIIVQIASLSNSTSKIGESLVGDFIFSLFLVHFAIPPYSYFKPIPGLLLYIFLDASVRDLRNDPPYFSLSPPQSGSSISDIDQILSLLVTLTLLAIQWKAQYLVLDFVSFSKRKLNWNDGNERKGHSNEDRSDDDEPLLPLPVTEPSSSV
jgi:hypothetical protein